MLTPTDPTALWAAEGAKRDPTTITFTVRGSPVPQGSPRAFVVGKKGEKPRAMVVSGAKGKGSHGTPLASWRTACHAAAVTAMGDRDPFDGPISLEMTFHLPRPASHFVANDRGRVLKRTAPRHLITRPDVGKLARAVEDSLSSVIYLDDSQVVDLHPVKAYGAQPGVTVTVRRL